MNDSRYIIQTKTPDGIESPRVINRASFAGLIATYFDGEEIHSLVFKLPLDKENIPGKTKKAIAEALVEMCANRGLLQELWELCKNERPQHVPWDNALEPTEPSPAQPPTSDPPPTVKQSKNKNYNLWLVAGLLIAVAALLGFGGAWLVWGNGRSPSTSELADGLVFDFEEPSELINWDIKLENETMTPERTQKASLTGRYALQINASLTAPNIQNGQQKASVPQILLDTKELNLEHTIIIYRLYAPADAPDNLAAQLFLPTDMENMWGPYTHLTPGMWTTLSWSPGLPTSQIGIEIKMDDATVDNPKTTTTYTGPIYIDRVEILPTNKPSAPISSVNGLFGNLVKTYNFEDCASELSEWILAVSDDEDLSCSLDVSFAGGASLAIPTNISRRISYDIVPESDRLLELKDDIGDEQIILARVYIPKSASSYISAGYYLLDRSGDEEWYVGYTENPLIPGQWTTLAWSTQDTSQNYDSWVPPAKLGLIFTITGDAPEGEAYNGFIYVDMIEIHQLDGNRISEAYRDPTAQPTSQGVVYSFEDREIGPQWVTEDNAANMHISRDYAFEGRYALAIDANLTPRESNNDMSGTATLKLISPNSSELVGQVAIFRVYIPENAPTNLLGQLFLDYDGPGIWGDYQALEPGKWTTLVWSTADAPPWDSPANIGLHVILEQPDQNTDTDASEFADTFYVDMVELLPLPVRYAAPKDPTSLDANLEPALFYDFDSGAEGITLYGQANNAEPIWITEPNEGNVLAVGVNLSPYSSTVTYDNVAGGICLSSANTSQIQAIRAYVYASEGADNLTANITANGEVGGQSASFFGGSRAIQPGEWNLLYWSTANLQYCLDGEQGQCASVRTDNEGICISVTTDNPDGYEGILYFDDIGIYHLSE